MHSGESYTNSKKSDTMNQVQSADTKQQPSSSSFGIITYLSSYMQDIFEIISDLGGQIKKEALFNGLSHM